MSKVPVELPPIEELRELYRGAVEEDDGWPVNMHDAQVRIGARFYYLIPLMLDRLEAR